MSELVPMIEAAFDASPVSAPGTDTLKTHVSDLKEMHVRDEADIINSVASTYAPDHKEAVVSAFQTAAAPTPDKGSQHDEDDLVTVDALNAHVDEWVDIVAGIKSIAEDNRDELAAFDTVKDLDAANGPPIALKAIISNGDTATETLLVWGKSYVENPDIVPDELAAGDTVTIENAPVDTTQGTDAGYEVQVGGSSEIRPAPDNDISVDPSADSTFTGCIVGIESPSGFVERCSTDGCTRVLKKGRCTEHGDVAGENDLRLKLKVDDGTQCITAYADEAQTEAITGIDMEAAHEMAQDAMDRTVVVDAMADAIMHRTVALTGGWVDRPAAKYNIESITMLETYDPDLDEALITARSLAVDA